ncbi:hypothetical protein ACFWA9_32080 [Kitasatospora sp. NPDC059973]|uniref:hypothetical protein n=1 Tax=Kitasatospora sp. NPDC059973 TaxID=3347020 RepID=UPI00368E15CD
MGRKKPGKPRRERGVGEYTLQQLQPPGYDEWMSPAAGFDAERAAADPRLSSQAVDLMRRLGRLRPVYGAKIPLQAVWLDMAIDGGVLRLRRPDGSVGDLPADELAGMLGGATGVEDVRNAVHELHATGMLLVEPDGEDDTVLRVVIGKPTKPGDPWLFGGDIASDLVPKTCIPGDPQSLGHEEFAALAYLRAHLAEGTLGTAEDYATFKGVGSVERAQELFDAVADLVDVRGCPACPTAHLCTRDPDDLDQAA